LITNELLTNAYRYAFPTGSTGSIRVELRLHAGIVELAIGDTGIGLPEGKGALFNRTTAGGGARQTD
ncbi:MAG: ATP-binding protein, partial [Hyphomicrobiaceae bacterium]